jgi:hypothetical protein
LDALGLVGRHVRTPGQVGDAEAQGATLVIDSLAEGQGFANGDPLRIRGLFRGHAVRAAEKTSASASDWVKVSRCELTSATIREGIETVRLPASDLGGARNGGRPATSQSWRAIRTVLRSQSMSTR